MEDLFLAPSMSFFFISFPPSVPLFMGLKFFCQVVYPETKIGGSARGLVFVYIFELLLLFRPLTIASMAHVVTDHCLDCKYTYCVDACPVDAFHQGPNQLFINPDTCIDCGACVSECPVGAIEVDLSLPEAEAHWIDKNKIASLQYPVITSSIEPLLGPRCIDPSA